MSSRHRQGQEIALRYLAMIFAAGCWTTWPATAQQPSQGQQQPQVQQPQASQWERLPRLQLERQFAGPLRDTLIQRWRDPVDGTVCYIYLPISAQHSPPTQQGFVQYGANTIGSISCAMEPAVPKPQPTTQRPLAMNPPAVKQVPPTQSGPR